MSSSSIEVALRFTTTAVIVGGVAGKKIGGGPGALVGAASGAFVGTAFSCVFLFFDGLAHFANSESKNELR